MAPACQGARGALDCLVVPGAALTQLVGSAILCTYTLWQPWFRPWRRVEWSLPPRIAQVMRSATRADGPPPAIQSEERQEA